jgi:predicted nucleotidyltransferase
MKSKLQVEVSRERLAEFCRRWNVVEFALFGSALREDFHRCSDVDALVTFAPGAKRSVFDWMQMKNELSEMFGRPVDLLDKRAIEQSDNYIRRRHILETAEVIYGT